MLGPYELDQIYTGESGAMLAALPDNCIDLTVTSPPYDPVTEDDNGNLITHPGGLRTYNGYTWDFATIAAQLYRVTKPGGVVVWVVGDATVNGSETGTSFRQALGFMGLGFNLHDTMIYQKGNYFERFNHKTYPNGFEYMFVFSKEYPASFNSIKDRSNVTLGALIHGKSIRQENGDLKPSHSAGRNVRDWGIRNNVWYYPTGGGISATDNYGHIHPAIFPEALARDHIISWSNPGDLVLDPFIGSGTTAKMAKELGRHWLGFDISPEYVELARRRVDGARVPLFVDIPQEAVEKPEQSPLF